jgi:hypothetical protein
MMADIDKDGVLDLVEFSIAMHLIHKVLSGLELPPQLPEPLLASLKVTVTSVCSDSSLSVCFHFSLYSFTSPNIFFRVFVD